MRPPAWRSRLDDLKGFTASVALTLAMFGATLGLAFFLAGCATHVDFARPAVTVIWGDAYYVECVGGADPETNECIGGSVREVRGGYISKTFGGLLSSLGQAAAGVFGGNSAPQTIVVHDGGEVEVIPASPAGE